ncbi:hypothetical protein ACFZAV_45260 [Streptomyces sp. NPDC008343]|uniref:hypothetical protein n=1 Tax=Streptomyces sp. NPDC008343 TaxID=3364828 RepID=UPI0036E7725F
MGPEFENAKQLPTNNSVTLDSGAKSPNYAYEVPGGEYDNGYWMEVTREDDPNDRTVAKFYRWNPGEPPPSVTQQDGTGFKIESTQETKRGKFSGNKTRIIITDPHGNTDTPYGGSDFPHPVKWEMDANVGSSGSSWQTLDGGGQQWKLGNLRPNADYWFRCYDKQMSQLSFNGYTPKPEEINGDVVNGKTKAFWVTSDDNGTISVLRPSSASSQGGPCDIHAAPNEITAKRITGASKKFGVNERPIYRVDIKEKKRIFDSAAPGSFRIPPYTVEGKDASGNWRKVGTVLPSSTTAANGSEVTYGGTDFLFQNKPGETITHLRVAGGYGVPSNEIPLAELPEPTVTMNDIADMAVKPTSSSGRVSLEANGSAQEELKMRLFDQNGSEIPATGPLADVYDSVYFRDENGKLITGMYERDGASAVTHQRGATINTGGVAAAGAPDKKSAFLSTTDAAAGLSWITPNLDLDDHSDTAQISTAYVAPKHAMEGSISSGVPIFQGAKQISAAPASPSAAPMYRVEASGADAVDNPSSVAVFRYQAMVPSEELPRKNIQADNVAALPMAEQAGTLKLQSTADLTKIENLMSMTLSAVTKHGTAVGPYRAAK